MFLGAVAQLLSGYWILSNQLLGWSLLAHGVGALCWGAGAAMAQHRENQAASWFAAAVALVLPGVGWLVSAGILHLMNSTPPRPMGRALLVWRDRKLRRGFGIRRRMGVGSSIAEILRGPDPASRRSAILAAKELEVRQSLPLLRKGLQDSDEQVRIYAQNILSGMLESFESRIKELEKRSQDRPTDSATALSLAEQYFELVYLDVAGDEETSDHLLAKAVTMLEQAAKQSPKNAHIALLRLRYALRQRDRKAATAALAKLESLRIDEQMVLPWRIELAFQHQDWAALKELLGRFQSQGYLNPRIEMLARFWRVNHSL